MFFLERIALADQFRAWAAETNALECPENVIAFLSAKDLINEEKATKLIRKGAKNGKKHNSRG